MTTGVVSGDRSEVEEAAVRQGLPLYVWAFTLLVPLSMFTGQAGALGVPLPLDRLVLATGIGLLILTPAAWSRLRLRPVHVVMGVAVAGIALSAAATGVLLDQVALFALLDRVLVPFLLFALAPVVWSTPRRRALLVKVVVVTGLYLGTTALLEMVAPQLVWPAYIVDPEVGIQYGRARGPFVASEAAGLVLGMAGAVSALGVARLHGTWRSLAGLSVLLCTIGTALTLTRSIWLGTVLGLLAVCVLERRLRLPALVLTVSTALVGVVVVASVPTLQESFTDRATTSRSLFDRANTNAAGLRVVEDRPLTGLGWTRFAAGEGMDYIRQADDYPLTNVRIEIHNVPLSRAAETGLPVALAYVVAVLLSLVTPLLRHYDGEQHGWRLVAVASVLMWLTAAMLSPVPYPTANYLVWLLAGVAAAPVLTRDGGDPWAAVRPLSPPTPAR
ncbi:O-antigen ligase family protein [Aquipuribacter nitratireducens]|uniref:O-antigen ligase family protein n=1 Tax=Aquipuribacter nitratireducens TaxID=650104 RepID=A0ABW0GQR5_9MICO